MADFNAGSISGTLDLDISPFRRGLEWAKMQARKFEDGDITPSLDLETRKFTRAKDKTKAELDKLDHETVSPKVDLDTRGLRAKLAGINAELHKLHTKSPTTGAAMLGAGRIGLIASGLLSVVAAAGPASAAVIGFGGAAGAAFGGAAASLGLFAFAAKDAFGQITAADKAQVAAKKTLTGLQSQITRGHATAAKATQNLTLAQQNLNAVLGNKKATALQESVARARVTNAQAYVTQINTQNAALAKQEGLAAKAAKGMTGQAGAAEKALAGLKSGWKALMGSDRSQMFGLFTQAFSGATTLLPQLIPLLRTVTKGVSGIVTDLLQVGHSELFDRFLKSLQGFMKGFLQGAGPLISDMLSSFMHIFIALRPLMSQLGGWIMKAAEAGEKFSASLDHGGIKPFISTIERFLPLLGRLVTDTLKGLGHIGTGLAPLAAPALRFIDALVRAIGGLNFAPLAKGLGHFLDMIRPLLPILRDGLNGAFKVLGAILDSMTPGRIIAIAAAITTLMAAFKIMKIVKDVREAEGAFAALNVILDANPIGIVVLALGALALGLVYAYKHSETFRKIVDASFTWVKKIGMDVVHWFSGPFVRFFTKTIPDTFNSVLTWVKRHWVLLTSILTGPLGAAVIQIAIHRDQIEKFFQSLWNWVSHSFSIAWMEVKNFFVSPVQAAATNIGRAFDTVKRFFSNLWGWVTGTFHRDWNGLENYLTVPVTRAKNGLHNILTGIETAFHRSVSAVKGIWGGLEGAISGPVRSALGWLSDHFVSPINSLLSKVGLHFSLPTFSGGGQPPGLAGGGTVGGPWKGPKADNVLGVSDSGVPVARVNPREYVEPVASVDYYGVGLFDALRRRVIPKEALPGYSIGGVIKSAWGSVSHAATSIWSSINPAHLFESLAGKLTSGFDHNMWGQVVGAVAKKTVGALGSKITGMLDSVVGGGGGGGGKYTGPVSGGVQQWAPLAARVLAMTGQSLSWLPTLLHRMQVESGGNPNAINLWDVNAKNGDPSRGLMQTIMSTFNAYAGPFRSRGIYDPLANIYAAVRYALARYGVPAVGGSQGYSAGGQVAALAGGGITTGPILSLIGDNPGGREAVVPLDRYHLPTKAEAAGTNDALLRSLEGVRALLAVLVGKTASADELSSALGRLTDAQMRQLVTLARAA